jgi:hypothetical protein
LQDLRGPAMRETIFVVPRRLQAIGCKCAQIFSLFFWGSKMKVEKTTRKKKPAGRIFVALVPA